MLSNWIKRMGTARLVALTAIGVFTGGVLIETAEARVGRSRGGSYRSFGNRGSRTQDSGGPGNQMAPINGARQPGGAASGVNGQNNRGSWLQRNPLLGGLMGAVAGTVIGSMLMNAFGGMGGGGMGGILMLLLGGLALFALFRMMKSKQQPNMVGNVKTDNFRNPGFGGNQGGFGNANSPYSDFRDTEGPAMNNQMNNQSRDQGLAAIALEDSSMTNLKLQDTLTNHFFQIQEAWSAGDRATLNSSATPEMQAELIGDLQAMEQRGERNIIKNIVMRSFDITEAWQEGEVEYATASINARLIDYTERNGQVIEGDASTPVQFSEYWTFTRQRGRGEWKLSAINQEG